MIDATVAARSGAHARFLREARGAGALGHPNVASVFQYGVRDADGQPFYAMELIDGETLEERVHRSDPLSVALPLEIAQLVRLPYGPSYGDLRLDPDWDALRGDARFEALCCELAAALLAVGLPSAGLSAADLTVDGGNTYTVKTSQSYGNVIVGNTGTGTINHSAGTFAVGQSLYLGNNATGVGTHNLSGTGALTASTGVNVGYDGQGDFEQIGGSVALGGAGLFLGVDNGSSGTYNLTAGSVAINAGGLVVGDRGGSTRTMTQSGGTLTVGSGLAFALAENPGSSGAAIRSAGRGRFPPPDCPWASAAPARSPRTRASSRPTAARSRSAAGPVPPRARTVSTAAP